MAVSFRDLVERRVPQYLAVYLGVGWAVIEFLSFLEERFSFSPVWTNLVLFAAAIMIPSVLLFTWNHGRKGRDRWTRAELIGIPLNFILAVFVLGTAFSGADLSATTVKVTVTDEAGNEVERRVANASYRKRLALFNFDTPAGDTALAWMGEGAAMALAMDLSQDIFVDMRMPAHFREQLREAGYADARNVPFQLKQKIAQELHLPYFVTGSVSQGVEGVTVRIGTYETSSGRLIRERISTSSEMFAAIDDLSQQLKQDLGLPATRPEGVKDLPVAEMLSVVPGAFRGIVEGQSAFARGDWAAAQQGFARAVQLDSTFAVAQYALYQTQLVRGDAANSTAALNAALRHSYRMPERQQFLVKTDHYFMQRDMEKAYAVVNMMVELYPDDLQGHAMRTQFLILRDERDEAIASMRRILELDPQQHEVLIQIAALQEKNGAFDDALATYQDYAARFPNDVTAQLRLARAQQRTGRLTDARASIERALIIEPTHVEATVESALLYRSQGDVARARRLLDDALSAARTPEDQARVYGGLQALFDFRGQLTAAVDAVQKREAATAQFMAPVQMLSLRMSQLGTYVRAGQTPRAEAILADVRASLSPPLDDFWRLGQLELGLATRDSAMIAEASVGVRGIIDGLGYRFLESNLLRGSAMLHELRGDWAGAMREHERFREQEPSDLSVIRNLARCLRQLGRLPEAQAMIDEHLRSIPYSPESGLEAARIRLAAGDTAAARVHVQRAVDMLVEADAGYPVAADARQLLAELAAR
jgi:tetratricopeptide (TPR) repeat protein